MVYIQTTIKKNVVLIEKKPCSTAMLAKPIPVRFTEETDQRLESVAKANRLSKAELIRLAVDRFLLQLETDGQLAVSQIIHAPSDQHVTINSRDGKIKVSQKKSK